MFTALILQYLNELVEPKVGDFTTPKPFHAIKVQCFKDNGIKLLTEFGGKLPLKVFALIADLPIETCDLSHTPPPAIRTFYLSRKAFVERSKCVQRLFQRLRVLYLLTRAERQICVFHAEICPNALTCCRQRFEICIGCYYVKPIVSATVAFDCDSGNPPVPLAVLMKCIWHFIILPLTRLRIPFTERKCDTIVFQRPTRTSRICYRLELVSGFPFRFTAKFFEKTHIRKMYPFQFFLNRLAW